MSGHVAVVTDSAASLPPALARKWGIRVVPLQVIVDGESRLEGEQVTSEEVLTALLDGRDVRTSQPAVAQFEEAFALAAADGAEHVVAVLISGKMSGTVNGAQAAADAVDVPVTVVDTASLAMGTGFAAIAAASVARSGGTADAVAQVARDVAASARCIFTVDTLEHLKRGGRVSPAIAAVGKVFNVRPVLELEGGEVVMVERVRSTQRARAAVMQLAEEAVAGMTRAAAAVMVLGEGDFGDEAAKSLEARHPDLAMLVRTPVSAVLASHTGPGTLAAVVVDLPEPIR
ncbi:DegV family protein [Demequina activiva]|uniref:DegV domain-containing protein n=1 Tax=Demequina activiva TaxID=1582364 RepID=A0A919Q4L5_9MICO|nr:DegV family protein [Demequina activiva]GIG55469.1 DegV domain-containing protein [Demequina activiva]